MRHLFLCLALVTVALSIQSGASAEEKNKRPQVIELKIKAHRQFPMAVDIARQEPKLGVRDLKGSLIEKIERAADKEPF